MSKLNRRWMSVALGGVVLAGLASVPLVNKTYGEDREDRWAREHHPKVHAAIEALKDAREELDKAGHDFGGHKKESIEAIDRAIHQLELARDFDRK